MKKPFMIPAVLAVLSVLQAGCAEKNIRPPAVAGAFYPADPVKLSDAVEGYMDAAEVREVEGELVALIVPHAGYVYSGAVAGMGFAHIRGTGVDRVVLIGPSHKSQLTGAAVYTGDGYATPLGVAHVDTRTAASLVDPERHVYPSPAPGTGDAHAGEHSLEVEVPFLQKALDGFRLIPVVIGGYDPSAMDFLGEKIAGLIEGRPGRTLLVVSTDWSHYHDYDTAERMDAIGIEAVKDLSGFELMTRYRSGKVELCGILPALVALDVADRLGADHVEVFGYANSGDVTGDRGSVVGYAAIGIYRTGGKKAAGLTDTQKEELLHAAKRAVEAAVVAGRAPETEPRTDGLDIRRGAFVTLKKNGELRGCIGSFFTDVALFDTVREMAVSAAMRDPRFRPVSPDELKDITVEVSVLSPLRRISSVDEIEVGVHGLYITKDGRSGVLLPQVPVEQGWDRATFLAETCRKAGLPADAWTSGAMLYVFTAEVFGE